MSQGFLSKFVPIDSFINPPLIDFWKHSSADKIVREMELFGPDFEQYEEVQADLDCIAIDIAEVEREAEVNLLVCLAPKLKGLQILGIGYPISLPWQL